MPRYEARSNAPFVPTFIRGLALGGMADLGLQKPSAVLDSLRQLRRDQSTDTWPLGGETLAEESSRKERLARLVRTLALVWRSSRGWTLVSSLLTVVQGVLPLAQLYLMKLVVDAVTAGEAGGEGGGLSRVSLLVGLCALASLVGVLCTAASRLVTEAQSQSVADHVFDLLHAKSLEADLEYYESPRYYDTLHMAQQEAPYRPIRIISSLVQIVRNAISLLVVAGIVFSFHWGVALIVLGAAVPGMLIRVRYARVLYRWQRRNANVERRTSYFNWMLTGDTHAKELRLFGLGPVLMRRFSDLRRRLRRERVGLVAARSLREFLTQGLATVAVFGSLLVVAVGAVRGQVSLGDMVMLFFGFQRAQTFLREMLAGAASMYENDLFIANFYEFLDLAPRVADPAEPKPLPVRIAGGISFDKVAFRYPGGSRDVVRDVSLDIRPGEHVALVGPNGTGKTTLVKLLCRLYDPIEGSITVDGVDVREFSPGEWRKRISVIFQDFVRYHLSARENIWFGNVDLPDKDPRIEEAARAAGADEVIRSLPDGYDTTLGRWFEGGEELSIGQWQTVALARAFVRDAEIIILDEPTSSLDAKAEYEVFQKFHELAKGRMAVIISHRMSTVRMADRILVLNDGRVEEEGSHEELLARKGTYATLFELQARNYR